MCFTKACVVFNSSQEVLKINPTDNLNFLRLNSINWIFEYKDSEVEFNNETVTENSLNAWVKEKIELKYSTLNYNIQYVELTPLIKEY